MLLVELLVPMEVIVVDARVDLVMEDLEQFGAFERSVICVASPTGSGYEAGQRLVGGLGGAATGSSTEMASVN